MSVLTERLLSVEQAALYLGVRPRTIRKWIATGRLPVTRLGRRVLLDKQLLDGLILEKTTARRDEALGRFSASGQVANS
jgi:excisionase family DNA binding protein